MERIISCDEIRLTLKELKEQLHLNNYQVKDCLERLQD